MKHAISFAAGERCSDSGHPATPRWRLSQRPFDRVRRSFTLCGAALALLASGPARAAAKPDRPPNFIFILSDDIAQGDLGCYGQKLIQTPRLDQMAREGTRYLQSYCGTSVCAPSRSSFFTGLHTGHCPVRGNWEVPPEGQLPLPDETVTIAEVAKSAGYATGCMGKWGMGYFDTSGSPFKQGIDHFFGYNCQRHAHSYFPTYLYDDAQPFILPGNDGQTVGQTYAQELIQNDMIRWVRKNAGRPFLLFYAVTLPHGRHEIDDLGIYRDQPWTPQQKAYAAQVTRLDSDVGELLDTLRELGIAENTLVIFAGDNGSSFSPQSEIGRRFDQASNGLRGYKRGMYEGALRQAALAWWPGTVPAGRVDDQPWAFWDLMPTFVELSGAQPPKGYETDGKSLVRYLKGGKAPQRDYFYWELHPGDRPIQAARWGDWKAVRNGFDKPIEIYDLAHDAAESKNLAAARPDLVAKAEKILKEAHRPDPNWPLDHRPEKHKQSAARAWAIKRQRDKTHWIPPNAVPMRNGRAATAAASTPTQPNIIVYMVDDLGWNHLSADQGTLGTHPPVYRTPNVERLANLGLSFTHAYAQPNCAPTRAAMLSGQYPARVNNQVYVVGNLNRFAKGAAKQARFRGARQSEDVAPEAITVAEALKRNGYTTAHIGKYHVGGHGTDATLPEHQGFDINLGGFSQGHQPVCFASQQNGRWGFRNLGRGDFDRYAAPYTEAYVKKRGLPASLVGTPKHVCDALGDAVEETIATLAAGRQPFYLQFHSYAVHGPVRARPDLKEAARRRLGGSLPAGMLEYVGFIAGMDENLGRILAAIEDPNGDSHPDDSIAANTLVLFTSDNGGIHASNEPLRGRKGMFTEGGIRVPLIAYWKGVIPADTVSHRVVHSVDYYPTYLDLAGRRWQPPEATHPLDGESFADTLRNPALERPRRPLFYLFPGYLDTRAAPCTGVIADLHGKQYKLFYFYETDSWELYCLSDDIGETHNLIRAEPGIAATLSRKLQAWLTQEHPTWRPQFPLRKETGQPAGPPPIL